MSRTLVWFGPQQTGEPDAEHMQADAEMFAAVEQGAWPTMRCYRWREAAVTMGRHQSEEAVRRQFGPVPLYRRPTGGRAVLHGDDLTVSLAIDSCAAREALGGAKAVAALYAAMIAPAISALSDGGLSTGFGNGNGSKSRTIAGEDCFASAARCDVLDTKRGIKIIGCALRRSASAVLLQMSLRPVPELDIHSSQFVDRLHRHYERCISCGSWNVSKG